MKTLDVRGLSCPEPVILVKQAVAQPDAFPLTVLSDSIIPVNNILRFSKNHHLAASYEQNGEEFTMTIHSGEKV